MTTDDIIELAKQAGFKDPTPADGYMGNAYDYRDGKDSGGSLARFAALVRAAALAEQPEQPEQETGNWIVYNSGAEVASGLSLAEAMEYLTPERLARQWCAVCVVDQSNLPKTPQPAKPAEQEPVAWIDITDEGHIVSSPRMYSDESREERPLYTAPQPRRRLTDEDLDNTTRKQVDDLLDHIYEYGTAAEGIDYRVRAIARAIERAHGIGGQP